MKENKLDRASDLLKARLDGAKRELKSQFKGANPYRKQAVGIKEQLLTYAQMTPEMELMLRAQEGNEKVNEYISEMEEAKRRYK